MKKIDVSEINNRLAQDACGYAREIDAAFRAQIEAVAEDIRAHINERPIVLLSGPSGSGKTTSAMMIEKYLDEHGCESHTLSMDNYFRALSEEEQALAAAGKIDLESPDRMDIPELNSQLADIYDCKPLHLARYNFKTCQREYAEEEFCRKPGELVILEGIHALNPAVITLPEEQVSGVYVSVRTRVTVGDKTLHPAFIRLMRRMLRDRRGRARSFAETAKMFESVQRGENQNIMPYKHRASYDIDTFHAYELAAYHALCDEDVSTVSKMQELRALQEALEQLIPLQESDVPAESLVREFIGNSLFTD